MKLIISQNGVKRVIEGSFDLCLSKPDATHLRDQLQQARADDFSYGWITVYDQVETGDSGPNSVPLKWTE